MKFIYLKSNKISNWLILVISAFLLFTLQNCKKDQFLQKQTATDSVAKDDARLIFSKALSTAMKHEPLLKEFLKQEALKKFNGDYDVLYAMVKDKAIGNSSFSKLLSKYANFEDLGKRSSSSNTNNLNNFFLKEIIDSDPYLTIYIPEIHFKNPTLFNEPTIVAVITSDVQEGVTDSLNAYTANGSPTKVSERNYPITKSVFVVKSNERIVLINKNTYTSVNGNPLSKFLPVSGQPVENPCSDLLLQISTINDRIYINGETYLVVVRNTLLDLYKEFCVLDPIDDDTINPRDPCECDRDCRINKDEIFRIKFDSYTAFAEVCSWWDGDIEIYVDIVWGATDQAGNIFPQTMRKDISLERENCFDDCNWFNGGCDNPIFVNLNWETFTWDARKKHTETKFFSWWEEDETDVSGELEIGTTLSFKTDTLSIINVPLNVSLPIKVKVKWDPKHDRMGESIGEYCDEADAPGEEYNTGTLKFNYRRR